LVDSHHVAPGVSSVEVLFLVHDRVELAFGAKRRQAKGIALRREAGKVVTWKRARPLSVASLGS